MVVRTTTPAVDGKKAPKKKGGDDPTGSTSSRRKWPTKTTLRFWVACTMGVIIPTLTLVSSYYAGVFSQTTPTLAILFTLSGLTAMAVSVGHLQWSIRDTTPTPPLAAWATALLIDGMIALGEAVQGTNHGDWKSALLIMVLWGVSVLLNIHAFLNHKPKK
jgi:hypothetical protein